MPPRDDPRGTNPRAPVPRRAAAAVLGAVLLAGCATWSDSFHPIERRLLAGDYHAALAALERQGDADDEPLLYSLNRAMVLRMAGDYAASNQAFERAKALIEEYSALSLREEASAFIINDGARAYAGEEHERVLVHLYEALNYLALGDLDGARVEALQLDLRLRRQAERAGPGVDMDDAFARYLTGMIYEDLGEWSNALIAYRKGYEAYEREAAHGGPGVPEALVGDLLRLTEYLGLAQEHRRYADEYPGAAWTAQADWRRRGELVLLLHNGLAPVKREASSTVLDPGSGHLVRISLPYYQPRAPRVRAARVEVAGHRVRTELVEDVAAVAQRTLAAKMPAITARAIARAVVKVQLARAARARARDSNSDNALAAALVGLGVEVANVLTERADTRSWVTLPHDIQLARVELAPGHYRVRLELLGAVGGIVGDVEWADVEIRAGRKTWLSRHWVASQSH